MAVSKRTRFEVLRRDNYTCRYCRSTEGELTIDHVKPIALGGSDSPDNLVACCKDCNAGKTSTSPDAETVAQVADDAVRWAAAMAKASEITEAKAAQTAELLDWFDGIWATHTPQYAHLPADYESTIVKFVSLGLGRDTILAAVTNASGRYGVGQSAMFRYFCGICWNTIRELQQMASEILVAD